jgi:hypothetical protein
MVGRDDQGSVSGRTGGSGFSIWQDWVIRVYYLTGREDPGLVSGRTEGSVFSIWQDWMSLYRQDQGSL